MCMYIYIYIYTCKYIYLYVHRYAHQKSGCLKYNGAKSSKLCDCMKSFEFVYVEMRTTEAY